MTNIQEASIADLIAEIKRRNEDELKSLAQELKDTNSQMKALNSNLATIEKKVASAAQVNEKYMPYLRGFVEYWREKETPEFSKEYEKRNRVLNTKNKVKVKAKRKAIRSGITNVLMNICNSFNRSFSKKEVYAVLETQGHLNNDIFKASWENGYFYKMIQMKKIKVSEDKLDNRTKLYKV